MSKYLQNGNEKNINIRLENNMFTVKDLLVEDVLEIDELQLKDKVICIEGQSGSGKSTFIRLLNNLDDPKRGEIEFKQQSIFSLQPQELRKKIVMVPQNPMMFDGTIRDNLLIGLRFSNEEYPADERLKELLEQLLLEKEITTKVSDLSGGEKQRIALGRVLLMEKAEVFLLDEPTSDLDDESTFHVMKTFLHIAKQNNQQTIIITHDRAVSEKFADTIINMDKYSMQVKNQGETHE